MGEEKESCHIQKLIKHLKMNIDLIVNIMVRLFIKEATTYYKFGYRNVCKSNFM
ncbi:hypothetical protein I79_020942 [Cricetulus griseus]|uniref:Uncharacterized protein n=1 Tax=Cricetulus griseus TaxID=10029 RepID=G3IBC2_CRIGR|nr:hypothetical protein I79_020942 [Cricetulus griseus]